MGPTLNPENIKEGDGVYFECKIKSNPKQYKTAWFHDVSFIFIQKRRFMFRFAETPLVTKQTIKISYITIDWKQNITIE